MNHSTVYMCLQHCHVDVAVDAEKDGGKLNASDCFRVGAANKTSTYTELKLGTLPMAPSKCTFLHLMASHILLIIASDQPMQIYIEIDLLLFK